MTFRISTFLLLAAAAIAQPLPQGVQKVTSVEGITEYSLPNGLHFLLFPDSSKPKVTVNITYLVGSRQEGYGESGMAHLLEHLLFKLTKDGRDIKKELTDHGAGFNGSTTWDRTNYYETVQASPENLKWAIGMEAARMRSMRIEKAMLDPEMTVVRSEFEMGENSPGRMLAQRALEAAYTFHNYGKLPIGARSDIEHVNFQHLGAFYNRYYRPDNAILMVAGNFDGVQTIAWIADAFGPIAQPAEPIEHTYTEEPTQDGERAVILRRTGDSQSIMALYHVPAASHPDTAALNVLQTMLGDAPTGRLYKALVDNKKAVSAGAQEVELHDPGVFMATATLRPDQNIDEAREALLKVVEGVGAEPPSKDEVERAKAKIQKQLDLSLTDTESIGITLSEPMASGDWRLLFLERDRMKNVTAEDVLRVAKAYLKPSNRTLGEFIPTKTPDRAEIPETPDLEAALKGYKGGEAVSAGEVFDPSPANIESRVSRAKAGDMKLVLLPKKTRGGTVVATVRVNFGDEKSLAGKSAIAEITGSLLMRGTKNHTRQQIQDEMDRLKANIGVSGGLSSANISIETTSANLAGALRLAAECLQESIFPDNEFELRRQQAIAGAERSRSEPTALAQLELARHMSPYPRGDVRYVSTFDEQIEDLKKVTLDQVKAFYKEFYGASNSEAVISGDFDKTEATKLMTELFGSWKSPSAYERVSTPYKAIAPVNRKIETPDKQNAMIFAGLRMKMNDTDPDYPAMILANYMFGGSTTSRLFTRLREKGGLSYQVQSGMTITPKDDNGQLLALAICNPANAPKAEAAMKEELERAARDGFTTEEVEAAKKSWQQERVVGRSQDQALAARLLTDEYWGRTMAFDGSIDAAVGKLTAEQVSAAFRKHVDPASLTVIKGGDFAKAGVYKESN
jgi:zinc protease